MTGPRDRRALPAAAVSTGHGAGADRVLQDVSGHGLRGRLVDHSLTLTKPFKIAYDERLATENLLVLFQHDDQPSMIGFGEATPVISITGEDRATTMAALQRALGALTSEKAARLPLHQAPPEQWTMQDVELAIEFVQDELGPAMRLRVRAACAALEGALVDLAARHRRVPLHVWLREVHAHAPLQDRVADQGVDGSAHAASAGSDGVGGDHRTRRAGVDGRGRDGTDVEAPVDRSDAERPRVMTSITVPLVPDDEVAALVREHLDVGFRILKVKAGLGPEPDLRRLRQIRDLVGSDVQLRVDANQGWTEEQALRLLGPLGDLDVAVLEQPLDKGDLLGHARLRREEVVPIMLDESVFTPPDAERALAAEAADLINIKLAKCGGPLQALHVADLAEAHGVGTMVGCMVESSFAILHGAHVVAAHDGIRLTDLDGATFLAQDPVEPRVTFTGGRLVMPAGPGIGVMQRPKLD